MYIRVVENKELNCCTKTWLNMWSDGNNNLENINYEHIQLNKPSSLHIIELTTNTVIEYVACHKLIDVYVLRNCIGLHNNNIYRIIILYEYLQNLKWLSVG